MEEKEVNEILEGYKSRISGITEQNKNFEKVSKEDLKKPKPLPKLPSFEEAKEKEATPYNQSTPQKSNQIIDHNSIPQRKNIFLIWLWSNITFGIYTAVWYMKRSGELNNLGNPKKLKRKVATTLLIVDIVMLALIFLFPLTISFDEMGSFGQNITSTQTILITILGAAVILRIIFTLYLAFKSRAIINQTLENKGNKLISWFFTLIFTHLYLQYEINRIVKDEEDKPRRGAWAWFIVILLIVIGNVIFSLI